MTAKASDVWKQLQGIVCTYKPAGSSSRYVVERLKNNICKGLNSLELLPPRPYLDIDRSGPEIKVNVRPSYADNVLCSGPRYHSKNVMTDIPVPLCDLSSGVLVVCVNGGNAILNILRRLNFTRCYHIKGMLGLVTSNYHVDEKVIARARFKHVTLNHFERTLASYQSAFQRRLFEEYGLQLQSQEAYNFAVMGAHRPGWKGAPIVYSLSIVEFNPPNFTLGKTGEVQCIHETQVYLLNLIHNLGVSLKSYATCTEIRCIRQGCFRVNHALLKSQWNVGEILDNVKLCWRLLEENFPEKVHHSRTVDTVKAENQ